MRFKLHLKPVQDRQKLSFNYQYLLQSWLYKLLFQADEHYASFLHNKGYALPDSFKTFKHFTFSSLQVAKAKAVRKGDTYMLLSSENSYLIVSFYIDKAAEGFIMGLFQNQQLSLFNRELRAAFVVERVETLPNPFEEIPDESIITQAFRTISPMVIAQKEDGLDQYLSPNDEPFADFFALNLIDRYRTIDGNTGMKVDAAFAKNIVKFKLLSDPDKIKKRGFTVKEGKVRDETKVIGYYDFSFEVTAPASLLKVGYFGGFGKQSSMGGGCVEVN